MHKLLVAVLLATMLVPATTAVDTSPQRSLDFADAKMFAFADNGAVIMGREDTGADSFGNGVDQDVWSIWNSDGNRIRANDADEEDCQRTIFNSCIASVVGVAISDDGSRAIIAAADQEGSSRVILVTEFQGQFHTIELAEETTQLAANRDLSFFAIGGEDFLKGYDWGPGGLQSAGTVSDAFSHDTQAIIGLVVAGDHVFAHSTRTAYRVTDDLHSYSQTEDITAIATAADWSAVGLDDGRIRLYGPASNQAPFLHAREFHTADDPIQLLAWKEDQKRFLAYDGDLYTYANPITDPDVPRIQATEAIAGINQVRWSGDKQILAIGNQLQVRSDVVEWSESFTSPIIDVQSKDGDNVGVLTAGKAFVLLPRAGLTWVDGIDQAINAGQTAYANWTLENDGNRRVDVQLIANGPWTPSFPKTVAIMPGASVEIPWSVTVPEGELVESHEFTVSASSAYQSAIQAEMTLAVLETPGWTLELPVTLSIDAGESIAVEMTITNNGNAANTTTLKQIATNEGWASKFDDPEVELGPGETTTRNITLTAPADAASLDEGRFTLAIPGFTEETITVIVGGRYEVGVAATNSPTILVGNQTTVQLTIENLGNAPDAYDLTHGGIPAGWTVTHETRTNILAKGEKATFVVTIQTDSKSKEANYGIKFTARSIGNETVAASAIAKVPVFIAEQTTSSSSESEPTPPISAPIILLGLGLLAIRKAKRV